MKKSIYYIIISIIPLLFSSCSFIDDRYVLTQMWNIKPRELLVVDENLGEFLLSANQYDFVKNDSTPEYIHFPVIGTYKILSFKYFSHVYGSALLIDVNDEYQQKITYEIRKHSLIIVAEDMEYVFKKQVK